MGQGTPPVAAAGAWGSGGFPTPEMHLMTPAWSQWCQAAQIRFCLAFFLASESCLITERVYLTYFRSQKAAAGPSALLLSAAFETKRDAVSCRRSSRVGRVLGEAVALK